MNAILRVENLKTYFFSSRGTIKAVDGISFDIGKGEVFGIVGESGSGKTLTALSILKIVPPPGKIAGGKVLFNGMDLLTAKDDLFRAIRGARIAMVFQDPSAALNPVFTIGYQVAEAVIAHQEKMDKKKARQRALEYLKRVHVADPLSIYDRYPHQLSGGTKQRAMIAMALINAPDLLILDEPTTALDVTTQAQILNLLEDVIKEDMLSILFISHDLGIISRMCGRVAIMRKGAIVETGRTEEIFALPRHPYTVSLLESVKALS